MSSTSTLVLILVFGFFGLVVALLFAKQLLGLVIINEREVGIMALWEFRGLTAHLGVRENAECPANLTRCAEKVSQPA